MKIKVNYDLMRKIKESENGIRLNKIVKTRLITVGITFGLLTPFYIMSSAESNLFNILYIYLV